MKKNLFKKVNIAPLFLVLCLIIQFSLNAQSPTVKVDFDKSGRQSSEVTASDYEAWEVEDGESICDTIEDIIFTFTYSGGGTGLTSNWYKAGIQSPNYVKLADDGLTVEDGEDGTEIQMTISGLEAGTHTLLLYHNNVDSPDSWTFADIDVYVNGVLSADDVEPSCRVLSESEATTSYHTFKVEDGEDVVVRILPDPSSSATNKNVMINGFELNTPNSAYQSYDPEPEDEDYHADADDGTLTLSWTAASTAVSHNVYIGTDESTVENATTSSSVYKGNQTSTTYSLSNLYSMNTYYWRVDEVASDGTITPGDVWSFRSRILAFPDAEGYGRHAIGGRGGVVVHVTSLDDSGQGTLREAIEDEDLGPRTIVFDVSGIITLESRLTLADEFVTVAGQTAPGKGICIRSAPFGMSGAQDAVIQDVRVRLGAGTTYDGMGMAGSDYCIIDHCSISWTIDEAFSSRSGKNITLQRTLISEALNIAGHENYPVGTAHGYAASISGEIGSFHHNLLAHCEGRNWSLAGGLDGDGYYSGQLDITNNVVYNWESRTTDGGAYEVNFVNNYYKPGAASDLFYALIMNHEATGLGTQQAYFDGNVMPGYFDEDSQEDGRKYTIDDGAEVDYDTFVDEPFFDSYVTTQSAEDAYKSVLSDVGCNQPVFDDHDTRIITETLNGSYTYSGSVSGLPGLPDDEDDVGGYEDYPTEYRDSDFDTDGDGLPDWWEEYYGLDTNSSTDDFSDANADDDGDGYTNLDDYLQWMSYTHYSIDDSENVSIDLSDMFMGYTSSPSYTVSNVENGSLSISSSTAIFTPDGGGMASFNLTVTDSEGATMTKLVNVFVEGDVASSEPTIIASATAGDGSVSLAWTSSNIDIKNIQIMRDTDSDPTGRSRIGVASSSATSYTDTDVTNGTTYYYWIKMVDSDLDTYNSAVVGATPSDQDGTITLSATPGNGSVTLNWSTSDIDIRNIQVYRNTESTTTGRTRIGTAGTSATSYTDSDVTNVITYYYWLKIVDTDIETHNSGVVEATPTSSISSSSSDFYNIDLINADDSVEDISIHDIMAYPNPVNDILYIKNGTGVASLYNMIGHLIYQGVIDSDVFEINMSSCSKGVYHLIVNGKKGVYKQKIVKE